jgi:hypothetical protein
MAGITFIDYVILNSAYLIDTISHSLFKEAISGSEGGECFDVFKTTMGHKRPLQTVPT